MWVLCFRRSIAQGALAGFVSGMGIAVADGLYGAVAAFGLTAVSGFLLDHQLWIGIFGGAFLVYLGVRTLLAKPASLHGAPGGNAGLAAGFLSTLGLTLANPPTILAFTAIFAALGLASGADYAAAGLAAPLAIVDLETTGAHPAWDRITEIAVLEAAAGEITSEWSTLVNPGTPIPPAIQALTGITDDMVARAPRFSELARALHERLAGRVFVAHNAPLHYAFLPPH